MAKIAKYTMFLKKIPFDKNDWLQYRDDRLLMVSDLINKEFIINLSKKEVVELLGFEFNDIYSKVWSYYLGRNLPIALCSKKHLYIYFNKEGKVFKVKKK